MTQTPEQDPLDRPAGHGGGTGSPSPQPKDAVAVAAATGRLADMVADPSPAAGGDAGTVRRQIAIKIAVVAGLFIALNLWQFRVLLRLWRDPDWSHGFIIPLFSLFLIWNRRQDIAGARARPFVWALPLMLVALAAQVISFYFISNYWLCQLSMIAMLFFLVLYLVGPGVVRVVWLPVLYLALAMPIPGSLYTKFSLPLQRIAAQGSAVILRLCGVTVDVSHSHMSIWSVSGRWQELTVAEACSGMRSLMAYVALGVAWAYLEDRPVWQRVILVLAIIPVAVLCNVIRVAITCTAYYQDKPEWGQDFMHTFTGMLMLIPALAMFGLLGWALKRLFVEDDGSSDGREIGANRSVQAAEGTS